MITRPPCIWGKEVIIDNKRVYHVRRGVKKEEIEKSIVFGGHIFNYLTIPNYRTRIIEVNKLFDIYPIHYSIPTHEFIKLSIKKAEDSDLYSEGLIDEDPQRLQIMLNIALEYYKFTGEIIWPNTFGKKEYRKIFEPWKNEHKKRFKVLMKIIEDYWAEEEREEKEGKKD